MSATSSAWFNSMFWLCALAHLGLTLTVFFHLRRLNRLPALKSLRKANPAPHSEVGRACPRVSVVLAARDEEARIENTVRRLLAQQEVALEVIVVDDRSRDRTGEILKKMATVDPRLKVHRVDVLPEGWLGKCHACHLGAASASGSWILFTDADCWMAPDVILRALITAEKEGVEHIVLTPGITVENIGARAWHLAFLLTLADWIGSVNRDRPKAYVGMGAFNLARAAAYHACGGYEALRLTVLDDVKLGLLLRRNGNRTRAFLGGDDVDCHWSTTLWEMIHVLKKNYFAALEYRVIAAIGMVVLGTILWCGSVAGPFTGSAAGMAAGLSLLSISCPAAVLASRLGWSRKAALLTPFIFPVLYYAVLNSTIVTLRHGGIRWRDTFYSLEVLRRGTVR